MSGYQKPIPMPDQDTQPYWEAAKRHELLLQRCLDCGQYRFYPRIVCPQCMSDKTEWVKASGRGEVYSFTITYRPPSPAFAADVPYVVAIIELQEGVRMMSNIVGCDPHEVKIGMPVEVVFEDISEDIALPKFRPAQG